MNPPQPYIAIGTNRGVSSNPTARVLQLNSQGGLQSINGGPPAFYVHAVWGVNASAAVDMWDEWPSRSVYSSPGFHLVSTGSSHNGEPLYVQSGMNTGTEAMYPPKNSAVYAQYLVPMTQSRTSMPAALQIQLKDYECMATMYRSNYDSSSPLPPPPERCAQQSQYGNQGNLNSAIGPAPGSPLPVKLLVVDTEGRYSELLLNIAVRFGVGVR